MIKECFFIVFFLTSVCFYSQDYSLPEDLGDDFVFFKSYDNKVHLLKNNIDYVFENKTWVKKTLDHHQTERDSLIIFFKKGFNNTNFNTINIDNKTYFVLTGGGPVLEFDSNSIIRIDKSVEQRNQYGSALFFHENKIYTYGGYGFWTYKDYLTYFDIYSKQWQRHKFDQKNSFVPKGRMNPIFHKTKDTLYVLGGKASITEQTYVDFVINDAFIIDFVSNTMQPIKNQLNLSSLSLWNSNIGFEIEDKKAYANFDGSLEVYDFKKNTSTIYDNRIFKKKLKNTPVLSYLDFFVFIKTEQDENYLSFVPKEKVLTSTNKTSQIFIFEKNQIPYKTLFALMAAFLISFFFFFLFSYKDYLNKFVLHDYPWLYFSNNKIMINEDQIKIIQLLEKKGKFSSSELNRILSKKKTYAKSHLTFLRQSFVEKLNSDYNKLTGSKEDLIRSKKNPKDKRQIIYFTGKKLSKKESFFRFVFKKNHGFANIRT